MNSTNLKPPGSEGNSQMAGDGRAAEISVQDAVEQFSGYCQRFAPGTRYNYRRAIEALIAYCPPATIADLTYGEINRYISSRLPGRKNQSVNNQIVAIKAFSRWLAETYEIANPAARLRKMPPNDARSRFLTPAEYEAVMAATQERDRELIQFLGHTGLRACELVALKPVHLQEAWLTVPSKGRKTRMIPLNRIALETVVAAIRFTHSPHAVLAICYKAAQRARIPRFGPHALRHYHATQLLARGVPIHHVSKLLGHSTVAFTERVYYHFQPAYLNGVTDCLASPPTVQPDSCAEPMTLPPAPDEIPEPEPMEQPAAQIEDPAAVPEPVISSQTRGRWAGHYEKTHRTIGGVKQKLCSKCKKWRAESDFYPDPRARDGLVSRCRQCASAALYAWRWQLRKKQQASPAAEPNMLHQTPAARQRYEATHRIVDGIREKRCSKCKGRKPQSDFYPHVIAADGLFPDCRECHLLATRQRKARAESLELSPIAQEGGRQR